MEKDIGRISKNDNTDIVIRVDDFGGRRGLTIREFVSGDRYTGFTKAGVRIPATDFVRFKQMVNSVSESEMAAPADDTGTPARKPAGRFGAKPGAKLKNEDEDIEVSRPGEELPDY